MRVACLLLLLAGLPLRLAAQSDSVMVSVVTFSPGNSLFTTFGHAAFRVQDRAERSDIIFNFGTYNAQEPRFFWKVLRGSARYYLATVPTGTYLTVAENREVTVTEQILNLPNTEARQLVDYLKELSKPENRYYTYNPAYDNCSTRILRTLQETQDSTLLTVPDSTTDVTWREAQLSMLGRYSWAKAAYDLLLGAPAEEHMTQQEAAYLPKYLRPLLRQSQFGDRPLVAAEKVLLKPDFSAQRPGSPWASTWIIIISVGVLMVLTIELASGLNLWPVDYVVFGGLSLLSLLIVFMWLGTDHPGTYNNYNLLWANPLMAIYFFRGHRRLFRRQFGLFTGIYLCGVALAWSIVPQSFPFTFLPLVAASLFRSVVMYLKN